MKKAKKKNVEFNYNLLTATVVIVTVIFAVVGLAQLAVYDNNILEIYADQQDDYVQLVLDQINMKKYYSDEEIIEDILNSLDASGQKYWTLSKDESILFVKDVTETYRYKGFTTETYYISDSAKEFLDGLNVNYVTHSIIFMDDDEYVASGVKFEYHDSYYRICLLTNRNVILENNSFLSAKVTLYIVFVLMIAASVISTIALGTSVVVNKRKINRLSDDNEEKNLKIVELNKALKANNAYQPKWNLYDESVLNVFAKKFQENGTRPIALILLQFDLTSDRNIFLEKAQFLLDKKVLRFAPYSDNELLLVFVQYDMRTAVNLVERMTDSHTHIIASDIEDGFNGIDEIYARMRKGVDKDEQ